MFDLFINALVVGVLLGGFTAISNLNLELHAGVRPSALNQVELRKLELAPSPKVLIADEAMAGLADSEVDDILALLMRLNGEGIAIIMIEHIMRAVTVFPGRIAVIVAGAKIADGAPGEMLRNPEVVRAYLGE